MRALPVLAAIAIVVGGCSDGTSTSTSEAATTTATVEPQATSSTVPPTTSTTTTATSDAPQTSTTSTTAVETTTTTAGTPVSGPTVASVVASVEAEYQEWWDYYAEKPRGTVGPIELVCDREGPVSFGDVLYCEATPLEEREYYPDPFPIGIIVTGDDGSRSYQRGDLETWYAEAGGDHFCRDLHYLTGSHPRAYFGAVAYWFQEGRPDRMDADRDGIPCETVYSLSDIDGVWAGTPREEVTGIHFGYITDLTETGSGVEITIDYAYFLGGLEADLAAEAAGEIAPGEGVPNDYFIVNENPRLRTFRLAPDAAISLVDVDAESFEAQVDVDRWVDLFAEAKRCIAADWPSDCHRLGGEGWLWFGGGSLPYWIQLDGTTVVRIEEQYLP